MHASVGSASAVVEGGVERERRLFRMATIDFPAMGLAGVLAVLFSGVMRWFFWFVLDWSCTFHD